MGKSLRGGHCDKGGRQGGRHDLPHAEYNACGHFWRAGTEGRTVAWLRRKIELTESKLLRQGFEFKSRRFRSFCSFNDSYEIFAQKSLKTRDLRSLDFSATDEKAVGKYLRFRGCVYITSKWSIKVIRW